MLGVTDLHGGSPPSWSAEAQQQGTTALPAGEQLDLVAEAAGRRDGVQELASAYEEEVPQVRQQVEVPQGTAVFILSLPNGKPHLVPADAPNAFVVDLGGRSLAELQADPLYAALPSFAAGSVWELPATSYRPDHDGTVGALDALAQLFGA
ncbi:hypothetical protein [Kineococcus sp. SYSU DK006]|uniref:hypothetical protein n=1 Tax=Kineococcus sp. SYSU DK006 TaxID=3383127 RepID=UPI003D7E2D15